MITIYEKQNTIIQYCLVAFLFTFIAIFFYIKLKYPFWNGQPVYHIYDYWRILFREPGIIYSDYPKITKFCNFTDCTTIAYHDANSSQINECIDILQTQYLRTDDSVFVFNEKTMDSYMTGHSYSSYITVYLEPLFINDFQKNLQIKALITSRSINIQGNVPVYYWDLICSNRELPIKRTYELIQTHNYRTRILNPDIAIGLFKRVGSSNNEGIVPIVKFSIRSYKINSYVTSPPIMPKYYLVVDINRTNIADVIEFLERKVKIDYQFWAITDMTNIEGLILSGVLYGYIIIVKGEIMAVYFFRDSRIFLENLFEYESMEGDGGSVLEFVCSANYIGSRQVFYDGFLHALFLLRKTIPVYNTLTVEGVGDNKIIQNYMNGCIVETTGAYYFYNYFYRTVESSQCFILL